MKKRRHPFLLAMCIAGSLVVVAIVITVVSNESRRSSEKLFSRAVLLLDSKSKENYRVGFDLIRKAAEKGNPKAQAFIGWAYFSGRGMITDFGKALEWGKLAAEQGDADAQNLLGAIYSGKGAATLLNYPEAVKWYHLAAIQGHKAAQSELGSLYLAGKGVSQNIDEGLKWYRLAAEQGDTGIQVKLGDIYAKGDLVPRSGEEAIKWYRLAADSGDPFISMNIAQIYATGDGVNVDTAESIKWLKRAAARYHGKAALELGDIYAEGRGVRQNKELAVQWYGFSRESEGFYKVAQSYATGFGVPIDQSESINWLKKAAGSGHEKAQAMLREAGLAWEDYNPFLDLDSDKLGIPTME